MDHVWLAGVAGFEPTSAGVKVPCLNRLGDTPTIHENHSRAVAKIQNGSSNWTRTSDILINSQTLYRLSYRGVLCGNYLLSHVVSNEVPSAYERLTTVFGMGTGGTVQASSPHTDLFQEQSPAGRMRLAQQVVRISVPRVKSVRTLAIG